MRSPDGHDESRSEPNLRWQVFLPTLLRRALVFSWWLTTFFAFFLSIQVAFTSLRPAAGGGGGLLAGGWSKKKGAAEADAFVVAEINPSERLVTYKAATVSVVGFPSGSFFSSVSGVARV